MTSKNNISSAEPLLHAFRSTWAFRYLVAGIVLLLSAGILWQTAYWVRQFAVADMRERKAHTLNLVVENLRGALAKFQYQPSLLAKSSLFRTALAPTASTSDIDAANRELERINFLSGALDTFLLNRNGVAVAASNWATEQSYLGQKFGPVPYYLAALQGRLGRYFSIDDAAETEDINYFFAYPVRRNQTIIGVAVVKLRVERLAERWLAPDHETLVVDKDGVIFMSSRTAWRFRSLRPLTAAARRHLRQTQKYGNRPLSALPASWDDTQNQVAFRTADTDVTYLLQFRDMQAVGWRVLILSRLEEINQRQTVALAVASFMLVSLILLAAFTHQRRSRQQERIDLQVMARAALETEVEEQTKDLTEANVLLRKEISDRIRAETELTKTRDELVQATKLAALGQMSAGLSHELNQPLAAIRSYSDNARAFLERADTGSVKTNLTSISELTERMARIIRNLRIYARNEPVEIRPTSVNHALDEALSLLDERLNSGGIVVRQDLPDTALMVNGGKVRLQQVFVNIVSNAIDAMEETDDKRLEITAEERGDSIIVLIHDTGPGLPDTSMNDIFDPFFSTKEVGEGMGLGLSISYGIVKQFGGSIEAHNHPKGGAVFSVTLKRSSAKTEAAE